jgi:hypothetical protein
VLRYGQTSKKQVPNQHLIIFSYKKMPEKFLYLKITHNNIVKAKDILPNKIIY